MPSNGKQSDHRVGMTDEDFALFCWLRQHPDVAATYGIKKCNGSTLVGSMLRQTLEAQGMAVEWHLQLPNSAPANDATGNAAGAQYIKKIGARPGQRLKNLKERLKELERANHDVPLTAAIKRRGGKPKVSFPLLLALARGKRARVFSSRGNRIGAPAAVALVERDVVTSFITKQLRCKCGAHLAFCRHASSQTGVCGAWQFVCERSCKLPLLETGTRLHGDDYLLNTKVSYACESCAIPFERLVSFLALLGVAPLSKTSHYTLKHEIEPVARGLAEESMAAAHQRNVVAGTTDYVSVDGGYTSLRNAHGCTMGAHAPDRSIVAVEHKRLSDEGATSSQKLEVLCFLAILARVTLAVYTTVVMDGCRELVQPALRAGKRVQGDLWHIQKNWYNWAESAIKQLCARPPVPDADKSELAAVPPVKPAAEVPKFGKPAKGQEPLEHAQQRVRDVGGEPLADASVEALQRHFKQLAPLSVMTPAEQRRHAARDAFVAEAARRKAAASERAAARANLSSTETDVTAWRRELRGLMFNVSMHTLSLRGQTNPKTQAPWTDDERATRWVEVWRQACLQLVLGNVRDPMLVLLGHPATKEKTADYSWKPPGSGFVSVDSFAFEVIDSLVHDPQWEDKFPALIDGRMTFANESYFHVLRKWCPQKTHYSRFYSLAIFFSVLSWNENVGRAVLGGKWVRGKSGPLAKSAGRWYWVARRADPTDNWRLAVWERYLLSLRPPKPSAAPPPPPAQSYFLGWKGEDPPAPTIPAPPIRLLPTASSAASAAASAAASTATAVASAATSAAVAGASLVATVIGTAASTSAEPVKPTVPALKSKLSALGLPTSGKKADLEARLLEAETNEMPAAAAAAASLARQSYAAVVMAAADVMEVDADGDASASAGSSGAVVPAYVLPGAYQLPAEQVTKRKREPGAPKWTAKLQARARKDVAAGKEPAPLVRNP